MSKLISKQISPFIKESNNSIDKKQAKSFFANPTKFYDNFKDSLKKKNIPEENINKLVLKINKITKYVDDTNKSILIVGKIQSGKTNSFLGVISKSLDENVNLIFIIAGVDKDIYLQNYTRVNNLFNNLSVRNNINVFDKNDHKDPEKRKKITNLLENNKKVVIVSTKNYITISKWSSLIEENNKHIKSSIIIDDEADQFTPNNVKKEKIGERAATNKSIFSLLQILKNKTTFISVTATPYVQILLSNDDYLKPDYAFLIESGNDYTPLSYFLTQDKYDRINVTNIIDDDEIDQFKEGQGLGDAFYESILTHIIHSVLFYYWAKDNNDIINKIPKMLINPGLNTKYHDSVEDDLLKFIENQIYPRISKKDEDILYFIKNILNDFNDFLIKTNNPIANKITPEDLIEKIDEEISEGNIDIQVINKNKKIKDNEKIFTFYIGSNKLSRGITIDSLITTFFFGRTKGISNADTVSQAARWLGYRNKYLFFLTIYLSSNLLKDYYCVEHINEELYKSLFKYEENQMSIKKLSDNIYLDREQNLTRPTKATSVIQEIILSEDENNEKTADNKSFFISHIWKNTGNDKSDSRLLLKWVNESILKKFDKSNNLNNLSKSNKLKEFPFIEFDSIDEFKDEISSKEFSSLHKMLNINKSLFNKIIERNKNKKVLFSFMQTELNSISVKNKHYNRFIIDDEITKITVGKTDNYTGDSAWFKDLKSDDYIIFQIYLIKLSNRNQEPFCKLALLQKTNSNNMILNSDNYYVIKRQNY